MMIKPDDFGYSQDKLKTTSFRASLMVQTDSDDINKAYLAYLCVQ